VLAALAPRTARAQEAGWAVAETPHFSLYGDIGTAAVMKAATDLEHLRSTLFEIAPRGRFHASVPFRVYLFRDSHDLAAYAPTSGPGGAADAGFLVPHEHGVYGGVLWASEGGEASRFLYKQYVLWVLHANLPELPAWLHQGLAEYYSSFRIKGDEAQLGLPVREHLNYLRFFVPVQESEDEREDAEERSALDRVQIHARAWALVHYLVLGSEETRRELLIYVRRVVGGGDPDATFEEVFGASRSEVEERLPEYLAQGTMKYVRLKLSTLETPDVHGAPLPAAEREYRLADLLLHARPEAASLAREHLANALALDPEHGPAHAALGWLAARSGDPDAALREYRKAQQLAGDDFLIEYLLGDCLLASLGHRRPESAEELATLRSAEEALLRSTELNPAFPGAWERLGYAYNLEPKGVADAVAALERAIELSPSRMDVALNLLLAYARVHDVKAADALLAQLSSRGADEATLARAREVRLRLALYEVNLLLRHDALDDAVALLAKIRAATKDPALAELADGQLQRVARAEAHNRYAALYQTAAELIKAGDEGAGEALHALQAAARPGLQTSAAADLAERWHRQQQP